MNKKDMNKKLTSSLCYWKYSNEDEFRILKHKFNENVQKMPIVGQMMSILLSRKNKYEGISYDDLQDKIRYGKKRKIPARPTLSSSKSLINLFAHGIYIRGEYVLKEDKKVRIYVLWNIHDDPDFEKENKKLLKNKFRQEKYAGQLEIHREVVVPNIERIEAIKNRE